MLWAVRWYCRYAVSYRDLEAMMTERGVAVDHSTIYRWVQRFAPEMEKRLRWLNCTGFTGESMTREERAMSSSHKYSPEVRERAVRMVLEHQSAHDSQWAAIGSIAEKIGCTSETLRKRVRQAERDQGRRPGLTSAERERLKALERENRELRRASWFAGGDGLHSRAARTARESPSEAGIGRDDRRGKRPAAASQKDRNRQPTGVGYLALLRKKLKLASCPAKVVAFAWQPMHVPP